MPSTTMEEKPIVMMMSGGADAGVGPSVPPEAEAISISPRPEGAEEDSDAPLVGAGAGVDVVEAAAVRLGGDVEGVGAADITGQR